MSSADVLSFSDARRARYFRAMAPSAWGACMVCGTRTVEGGMGVLCESHLRDVHAAQVAQASAQRISATIFEPTNDEPPRAA